MGAIVSGELSNQSQRRGAGMFHLAASKLGHGRIVNLAGASAADTAASAVARDRWSWGMEHTQLGSREALLKFDNLDIGLEQMRAIYADIGGYAYE